MKAPNFVLCLRVSVEGWGVWFKAGTRGGEYMAHSLCTLPGLDIFGPQMWKLVLYFPPSSVLVPTSSPLSFLPPPLAFLTLICGLISALLWWS